MTLEEAENGQDQDNRTINSQEKKKTETSKCNENVEPGSENWRCNSVRSAYITGMANMRYAYIPYHYGQMDKVPAFWEESTDV